MQGSLGGGRGEGAGHSLGRDSACVEFVLLEGLKLHPTVYSVKRPEDGVNLRWALEVEQS